MKESVSDSGYGHDDILCMTYDIHVDTFTWMCMGWFDHCMSTYVGSNHCRRLSLLGFFTPSWDPLFRYTRRLRSFEAVSTKKAGLLP